MGCPRLGLAAIRIGWIVCSCRCVCYTVVGLNFVWKVR